MARALTGHLLLQASLADAANVQDRLQQAECWPDILRIFEHVKPLSQSSRMSQRLDKANCDELELRPNGAAMWAGGHLP